MLVLSALVVVWYGSSMLSASSSKTLLIGGPLAGLDANSEGLSALELTCLQMCCAAVLGAVLSVVSHKGSSSQLMPQNQDALMRIVSLACVFSTGFITLNLAYTLLSVSLANTLRAMEPISSLLLTWLSSKESTPIQLILAIVIIVLGACLASYGNADFTMAGLAYCTIANFAFSYRTIQYKTLRQDYGIDHASLFCQTTFWSSLILGSVIIIWESPERLAYLASLSASGSTKFYEIVVYNGVTFFLYLQLSFATLSYITVVTHAILNSVRRPAVIFFDVIVHKTPLSLVNQGGIALACIGVTLYSVLKARIASKSKPA